MKTKIIAIIIVATLVQHSSGAFGAVCQANGCPNSRYSNIDKTTGCKTKSYTCYGNTKLASCESCTNGKSPTIKNISIAGCDGTYSFQNCECPSCTSCTSDSGFVSADAGYEKKTTATCDCGTCITKTEYRCAAGYYGSSTNGSSGCIRCPESGNSSAGSSNITDCYISGNFTDSTGSGTYTGSCYYK